MIALTEDRETATAHATLKLDRAASVLLLCTEGATDPESYRRLVADADKR
jgi:hypothetical protein